MQQSPLGRVLARLRDCTFETRQTYRIQVKESGGIAASFPSAWGVKNSRARRRFPRIFVLHASIVHLYSAHLAFMRCHTNLTLIGDRAEIRPPIFRIASAGSGGLADRKEEQSWLK
ncbi:MAG: hypothetical protein DLM68_18710 [Hyphomicrobiales bacterium]|nr:MAG: hypothetical protein DLM68_18710 [Hyphomicrobiales bacterium]